MRERLGGKRVETDRQTDRQTDRRGRKREKEINEIWNEGETGREKSWSDRKTDRRGRDEGYYIMGI